METPLSARRVTRSQTMAALTNSNNTNTRTSRKMEDPEKGFSKSRQRTVKNQDRSALIDITNDSPIVGLANGSMETPLSSLSKQRTNRCKKTPGSGEALLRGQVKSLLQKVEEEAEISKFSRETRPNHNFKAFLNSPASLAAPTPANTPQVLNFSGLDEDESLGSLAESPIEDQLNISLVVSGNKQPENASDSEKDVISRSLFMDFYEKSDSSSECSSVVTHQGTEAVAETGKSALVEDDDASIWSIQVNSSTQDEDEDKDEAVEDEVEDEDEEIYDDYNEESDLLVDELCEEMSKISVNGDINGETIMGKHTRFVYNSDDELVEEDDEEFGVESEVVRLKGLPTPKGKHLRFQDDDETD